MKNTYSSTPGPNRVPPLGLRYDPQRYRAVHFHGCSRQNLQKLYSEYEMADPYVQFHFDKNVAEEPVELHSHGHYELIYCTRAQGAAYLVGSERFLLEDGDLICIRPGVHHRPLFSEDMNGAFERILLLISARLALTIEQECSGAEEQNPFQHAVIRANTRLSEQLHGLFEAGARNARHQPAHRLEKMGLAFQILSRISHAAIDTLDPFPSSSPTELLDQIIDYVETHYTQKISLQKIADHFFVSPSTISHLCRDKLQVSFYQFVLQRRLAESKTLLGKGIPSMNISSLVGFSDYQNFYRAFKSYYGVSPREFKRMIAANDL